MNYGKNKQKFQNKLIKWNLRKKWTFKKLFNKKNKSIMNKK